MARALTTGLKNETLAKKRAPILLAFFDFYSGPVRVWNGIGTLAWGGNNFLGLGKFGSVSGLSEVTETQSGGPTFTLTGAPSDLIAAVFADNYQGREVTLWLGMLDLTTGAVIADPYQLFTGRMDRLEIDDQGSKSTIRVFAESRLHAPNQTDDRRINDADQQIDFPGDTGLAYMASVGQRPIVWGAPGSNGVLAGGGLGAGGGNDVEL